MIKALVYITGIAGVALMFHYFTTVQALGIILWTVAIAVQVVLAVQK